MKTYPVEKIRNVALVGHAGVGKTTLAEALLFRAGAIERLGRIEDGTTVGDYDDEAKARGLSLSLSLAPFEWKGYKINLIDTPGYADFLGDAYAALRVADLAIFVVSAVEGVEVGTKLIWRIAEANEIPRMVFINKLDKERADFQRTLDELRDTFGAGIAPLELPIGVEAGFHGIADLLTDTAYLYDSGHGEKAPIPAEMEEQEHIVHDNLVEGIVVADDDLLAKYLEGEVPSFEELERTLAAGVDHSTVFPVVCGSATVPIAVDRLADFIVEIGPSPKDLKPAVVAAGDQLIEITCDPSGDPLAYVFKTISDPYVGKLSLFKVMSGTIRQDINLYNSRTGSSERLHNLLTLRGKEQLDIDAVPAGDIAVVAKLNETATGDTLAPKGTPVSLDTLASPEPLLSFAITAATQADEDKLPSALRRLQEEDAALGVEHNAETGQMLLWGTGETHLSVTIDRLKRKFGVTVVTEEPRVPFRWTINAPVDAEGRYKKQSGGHGQFGIARVRFEPLERGAGNEFVDQIVGGSIPRQFIPAVEKGVMEELKAGHEMGYPIVDVRVVCLDGKYHSVDSSEMSFKMAGKLAVREAMSASRPVLLEPISRLEVTVPVEFQGDVMKDVTGRRGRVQATEAASYGEQRVVAEVPTSEIMRYAIDLKSITGGAGRFASQHSHYDFLPQNLTDRVVRASTGD
ncbi:MAG: elongation factor G [Acidimicrobiia bacterium]|nr:elongation factor G [Acidimicrobiia bacterium]